MKLRVLRGECAARQVCSVGQVIGDAFGDGLRDARAVLLGVQVVGVGGVGEKTAFDQYGRAGMRDQHAVVSPLDAARFDAGIQFARRARQRCDRRC